MRGLILRKTRASCTESAMVTFEEKVLPSGHPVLDGPRRNNRSVYAYPNGSQIVVGGMDKPTRILSTEYDMVYIQELIELTEDEFETIETRLRNGRMPYQQIIADTNPGAPTHWIKQREQRSIDADGRFVLLESLHKDNPVLWSEKRGVWTDAGHEYLQRLDALTGVRRKRFMEGKWVQAEGVVYPDWSPSVHLINRFPIPREWARYWSIDFGYTNPFVFQDWAEDPDGRLYLVAEMYRTQRLVEDHARAIIRHIGLHEGTRDWAAAKSPRPRLILCDHEAEGRATLERHLRMPTTPAIKEVSPGIQAVASRLRTAPDGKPRLFVFRDAVIDRDPALVERKLPTSTAEELDAYVWETGGGRKTGEEPKKENDHGADAMRYLVRYRDQQSIRPDFAKQSSRGQTVASQAPAGVFPNQKGKQ